MDKVNEAGVVAVDMDRRIVFLDSGERCQISNMIDADGEETDQADDAVALVFPIASTGRWGACER